MEKRCPSNNGSKPQEVLHAIDDLNGDVSKTREVSQGEQNGSTDEKIKPLEIPHAVVEEGCTEISSVQLSSGLILTFVL